MRVLILGGTSEAAALARALAGRSAFNPVLSLAGRVARPAPAPIPMRVGGFGGIDGLRHYLREQRVDAVIDATHPFAARMSGNARAACDVLRVPRLRLTRPPWRPAPGDRWIQVADLEGAVAALGPAPRRVFLTVGSLSLPAFAAAPWHHYLIRCIDPPAKLAGLPDRKLLLARGPFSALDEEELMRNHRIEILVTKNSGGGATAGKLQAARALDLQVIVVARPESPDGEEVNTPEAALAWLDRHREAAVPRGV